MMQMLPKIQRGQWQSLSLTDTCQAITEPIWKTETQQFYKRATGKFLYYTERQQDSFERCILKKSVEHEMGEERWKNSK